MSEGGRGAEAAGTGRMDAGLFAVSAAVLTLEILQTRIFSYSLSQITIYLAIGVCLLGLGASATVLATLPALGRDRARRTAAAFAAVGALCVPLSHAVFAHRPISETETNLLDFGTLVALTLPYFGFGMAIALLMVTRSAAIGRAYAFNLAGSGLGCLAVFPLLDVFGAEGSLFAVGAAGLLAALLIDWPDSWRSRAGFGAVAAVLLVAHLASDRLFPFPPEPLGQLSWVRKLGEQMAAMRSGAHFDLDHLHSRWDRTGRIDVYRIDTSIPKLQGRAGTPIETLMVLQDSTAGSFLLGVGDDLTRARSFFDETVYAAGYSLGPVKDALIIGLGGAPDVLNALYHDTERVVGVEINESMIAVGRDLYGDFLGRPYQRPGVEIHRMDGRTFLESTDESFDLIQMSSVDTKTLVASGSLALTNNYLYTREALIAMLDRLRPDGVIAIARFGGVSAHRLVATAVAALRELGAAEPERHIAVLGQGIWRSVLVKPRPFEAEETLRVRAWARERGRVKPDVVVPEMDILRVGFYEPIDVQYTPEPHPTARTPFLRALAGGRLDSFISSASQDLSAPTDDRPYFFYFSRVDSLLEEFPDLLRELFGIALRMAIVAAIFIGVPLLAMQRRGLRASGAVRSLVYFTCLGLGFMLVEIGLIHRFVLFLGHQSYAVTVVLFGLLVGASLGSITSSRVPIRGPGPARLVLASLCVGMFVYVLGLGPIFSGAADASFVLRLVVAMTLLIPLGFGLGIPFPLALRSLRQKDLSLVAWAIGVNGFASVVASTIAVPISMITGLQVVLLAGVCCYALAGLVVPIGRPAALRTP